MVKTLAPRTSTVTRESKSSTGISGARPSRFVESRATAAPEKSSRTDEGGGAGAQHPQEDGHLTPEFWEPPPKSSSWLV